MVQQGILLESGTNEVEILEFFLGTQSFGINVLKVKQIVRYEPSRITPVPESYPSVRGTFMYRGFTTSLIDLNIHLKRKEEEKSRQVILVCEFNRLMNGFLVDGVNRIHRISWTGIQPAPTIIRSRSKVTGMAYIEENEVPMLDFEEIVGDILGGLEPFENFRDQEKKTQREKTRLFLAEDSRLFRKWMSQAFKEANYGNVTLFDNGNDLFKASLALQEQALKNKKELRNFVIITDIEMPQMDGLTVCLKLKKVMPQVPIIIISSFINEQVAEQCEEVSADAYLNKNEMNKLIGIIDRSWN